MCLGFRHLLLAVEGGMILVILCQFPTVKYVVYGHQVIPDREECATPMEYLIQDTLVMMRDIPVMPLNTAEATFL